MAHTAHAYDLNSANQRVRMTLADGTYWAYDYDFYGGGKLLYNWFHVGAGTDPKDLYGPELPFRTRYNIEKCCE